jgi:hypothetical protein
VILARRWAVRREAEEEWNKVRPRRGLFDMDQEALVLRSPTRAYTAFKESTPGVTFRVFARRSSVASVGFRRPLSKWLR